MPFLLFPTMEKMNGTVLCFSVAFLLWKSMTDNVLCIYIYICLIVFILHNLLSALSSRQMFTKWSRVCNSEPGGIFYVYNGQFNGGHDR